MIESFCIGLICFSSLNEIKLQCPDSRTRPEHEYLADCRRYDNRDRNYGVYNQPNVCDQLNSTNLPSKQAEEYWRQFKCPLN